jgi:hypothetical protein
VKILSHQKIFLSTMSRLKLIIDAPSADIDGVANAATSEKKAS